MITDKFSAILNSLFNPFTDESLERYRENQPDHATLSVDKTTGNSIVYEWDNKPSVLAPKFEEASRAITEIDGEDVQQSYEEKVYKAASIMTKIPYMSEEERQEFFLENTDIHDEFSRNYAFADLTLNFRMGGQYSMSKPPERVVTETKPSGEGRNWEKYLKGAAIGGLILGVVGGSYLGYKKWQNIIKNRDGDGDGIPDPVEVERGLSSVYSDTDNDGLKDGKTLTLKKGSDQANLIRESKCTLDIIYFENPNGTLTFPGEDTLRTNSSNKDTDQDFVSDGVEAKERTNGTSIDSDGGGIDDFNELYTYDLNPNDPRDDEKLMEKIPDVEPKKAYNIDGGTLSSEKKYITVSLRDPLFQWYINNTSLKWSIIDIPEEYKGNRSASIQIKPSPDIIEGDNESTFFPVYQLANGIPNECGSIDTLTMAILEGIGYKTHPVSGIVPGGKHGWVETYIDGEVYVAESFHLYPRAMVYDHFGWQPYGGYDPDWYLKN